MWFSTLYFNCLAWGGYPVSIFPVSAFTPAVILFCMLFLRMGRRNYGWEWMIRWPCSLGHHGVLSECKLISSLISV